MSPNLVGNRLALAGTILYFLEWAGIAFLAAVPTGLLGERPDEIVDAYAGEAGTIALVAGWFSVALLGRVLFAAALRRSLLDSGYRSIAADFAVVAMGVSVALEVATFGIVAAAGWLADAGADAASVVALDAAGEILFLMGFGPIGMSVLGLAAAMVASRLFARWLAWLGVAAGSLAVLGGILEASATGADGTFGDLGVVPTQLGALTFWIWMIGTSVVLFRRAAPRGRSTEAATG